MSARRSGRSTRKPIGMPKRPSTDSSPNVQLIIRGNLTKFMGRRFPEFCTLRAVCLVNGRVSSSAAGDARVASYKAAIDSVAKKYYGDWPFMVEVLNKWLEMNKDFIRDPIGYAASNPSPTPSPARGGDHSTASTMEEAPGQPTVPVATTPARTLTQSPSIDLDSVPLSLRGDTEGPKHTTGLPPVPSTSRVAPGDLDGPLSYPIGGRDVDIPPRKFPLSWTGTLHFLPSLWNLGVGMLSSVTTRRWLRWFDRSLLTSSYKACLNTFRESFASNRRRPTLK